MTRSVLVQMSAIPEARQRFCATCGAMGSAGCDHDAPLISKAEAARLGLLASPEKSDRAIAAEIGVSDRTVGRARKSTATFVAVEKRIGRDGKARKQPKRKPRRLTEPQSTDPIQEECTDCSTEEDRWQRSASNFLGELAALRAYWTREFKGWERFAKPTTLVTLAKQADREWIALAKLLTK